MIVAVGQFFDTPEELQKRFSEAQKLFATGDFQGAISKYQDILHSESNRLIDTKRVEVRIEDLTVPVKAAALYQLGNVYRRMGSEKLRKAGSAEEALRVEGKEDLKTAAGYFQSASDDEALGTDIRIMAQYQIVECLFAAGDYREAIKASRTLLFRFPGSPYEDEALYTMGWSYYRLKDYTRAIESFEEVTRRFPEGFKADRSLFQIGESYHKMGMYSKAIEGFQRLVDRYDFSAYSAKELTQVELQRFREGKGQTVRELVAKSHIKTQE